MLDNKQAIIPSSRMAISDSESGMVTNPWFKWFNRVQTFISTPVASSIITPQFRAYRSSNLVLTGSGNQQVPMNAIEVDTANEYNTTTGIWTPSKTGNYAVSAGVGFSTLIPDGSQLELKIYQGLLAGGFNVRYLYFNMTGGSVAPQVNGADPVFPVEAGDQYSIVVAQPTASATVLGGIAVTWFSAAFQPPTYQA